MIELALFTVTGNEVVNGLVLLYWSIDCIAQRTVIVPTIL